VIIFKKEITEYYSQPFKDMFYDLKSIQKTEYAPNEQIIVTAYGNTDQGIWRHFFRIAEYLDIPTFFIHFSTNNRITERFIHANCKDHVNCTVDTTDLRATLGSTRFDYPETICTSPFTNLEIMTNGNYRPCCQADKQFLYDNDTKMNVITHSVSDAWHSESYNSFRKNFLQGKKPSVCHLCWSAESAGISSKRQHELKRDIAFTTDFYNMQNSPIELDIKLGFSCNSKCRICYYGRSSAWYKEDKKFNENLPKLHEIDYTFATTEEFWNNFKKDLQHLKSVKFIGGEPMLDKKHVSLLKVLPKDVNISYNTNATIFDQNLVNELKKFEKVNLSFSIDNIGEKFNYERHSTIKWNTVETNIQKYLSCNFDLDIVCTVSIFNVLDLDDVADYASKNNIDIDFAFLDRPEYFSVLNIKNKEQVVKYLQTSKFQRVQKLAGFFTGKKYLGLKRELQAELNKIDSRRNENFALTYAQISKLL